MAAAGGGGQNAPDAPIRHESLSATLHLVRRPSGASTVSDDIGASADSAFTGSDSSLHHGEMSLEHALAMLIKHSSQQTSTGSMMIFDRIDGGSVSTCLLASNTSGGGSTLINIRKVDDSWILEDKSFARQRFPSLVELAFYYRVRNYRNTVPVDGSVVLSDLTEDDLLAGVLALASVTVRSAPSTPHVSASTILPGMVATADGWPLGDMADLPTARQETDIFVSFSDSNQPDNPTLGESHIATSTGRNPQSPLPSPPATTLQSLPPPLPHRHAIANQPVSSSPSMESTIQREARVIINEDLAARQARTTNLGGGLPSNARGDGEDDINQVSCCALCCAPVCQKCSCFCEADDNLWRHCCLATNIFCHKRCLCHSGEDCAEEGGDIKPADNCLRATAVCCCYVDHTETPWHTTSRRGILPLFFIVIGHILFGLFFLLAMTGKFAYKGCKSISRRLNS